MKMLEDLNEILERLTRSSGVRLNFSSTPALEVIMDPLARSSVSSRKRLYNLN